MKRVRDDGQLVAAVAEVVTRHTDRSAGPGPDGVGLEDVELNLESLQVVALMLDLEQTLHVEFDTELVSRDTFATVGTICAAVQALRHRESPQGRPLPDVGGLGR